jgi:hypothetical protein
VELAPPFEDVDPFLGGDHRVTVEVGCPLFELGEILHAFQAGLAAFIRLMIAENSSWMATGAKLELFFSFPLTCPTPKAMRIPPEPQAQSILLPVSWLILLNAAENRLLSIP